MTEFAIPLLVLLPMLAAVSPGRAATWLVDPAESAFYVRLYKAGIGKALAHDHVVRATEVAGSISYDPERPDQTSIEVTVATASLVVDKPADRKRFDLDPLEEDTRRDVQEAMEGEDQMDVERHREIRFVSTSVEPLDAGRLRITGNLTLHGTTRELTFPADVSITGDRIEGKAAVRFEQSSFGIEPYSAALGAVKNQDEVELIVELVASRD